MITDTGTASSRLFRELWRELGLSLPELAEAIGRPRGTLTKYSHDGASSRPAPEDVLDAMDALVLTRARKAAAARGFDLMPTTGGGRDA